MVKRNLIVDDFYSLNVAGHPDVDLSVFDRDFCLVDCYYSMPVRFWIEQLCALVRPLIDAFV